jgi:hypothetical protein
MTLHSELLGPHLQAFFTDYLALSRISCKK